MYFTSYGRLSEHHFQVQCNYAGTISCMRYIQHSESQEEKKERVRIVNRRVEAKEIYGRSDMRFIFGGGRNKILL